MTAAYRQRSEPRTDWFRVLSDLARHGVDVRAIRRRLNIPKSTLAYWKQGNEPRHSDGERLLALWCEATGRPREDAPMCDPLGLR